MNRTFHSWLTDKDKGKAGPGSEFYDPASRLFPKKVFPQREDDERGQPGASSLTLELETGTAGLGFHTKKSRKMNFIATNSFFNLHREKTCESHNPIPRIFFAWKEQQTQRTRI